MSEPLVNIGEVIVHGVVFDPKNGERLRAMDLNNLLKSVPQLFDLLDERSVDYALVGGIAMLVYLDGRNTQDIDLIVARESLELVPEIVVQDINPEFARAKLEELSVDFLFTSNKLFEKVLREQTVMKYFSGRKIPCATVEAIISLKLFALPSLYRQGRFEKVDLYQNDVLRLMREFKPAIEPLFQELARHLLPSDMDELHSIVQKIETDIADSRKRFGGGA